MSPVHRDARFALLLLAAGSVFAAAAEIPPRRGRVTDDASLIEKGDVQRLEATLDFYESQTGRRVDLLLVSSLTGEPADQFASETARSWGLASNGVLLLVARDEGQVRLVSGAALAAVLPEEYKKRLIDNVMAPRFREKLYAEGLTVGVASLLAVLNGGYAPPAEPAEVRPKAAEARPGAGSGKTADPRGDSWTWKDAAESNGLLLALLALFEYLGLMVPNIGWIMYFFAMPICYAFAPIDSPWIGYPLLAAHLIGFPILKRSPRFQNINPGRSLDDQLSDFAWIMLTPRIFPYRSAQFNRDAIKSFWNFITGPFTGGPPPGSDPPA